MQIYGALFKKVGEYTQHLEDENDESLQSYKHLTSNLRFQLSLFDINSYVHSNTP